MRGRTGLFEVVPVDRDIGAWLAEGREVRAIRDRFADVRHRSLAADALRKVAAGTTAMGEVLPFLGVRPETSPHS